MKGLSLKTPRGKNRGLGTAASSLDKGLYAGGRSFIPTRKGVFRHPRDSG